MKKRLLSLLVAISMVLTFLPVSALTAAAEEGSSSAKLEIEQGGYPKGSHNGNTSCSGNDWSYDNSTKTLTLSPSTSTNYDFSNKSIHTGWGSNTDCNLIIGQHATVTDGVFRGAVTNNGTIIGGFFYSSVTNESDGIIENGQFGDRASSCTVTNNGGTINGGTFKDELTGSGIEPGYTLKAKTPTGFEGVLVNEYRDSCYIIPNQASVSVDISYHFEPAINFQNLPPLYVAIDNAHHMLLSDWCESNLKIEFDGHYAYNVTFTAPSANGSTVTISPLTRLVIDENGYPVGTKGGTQNYSGNGWKFENGTLTLESGSYDFSGEKNALRPLTRLVIDENGYPVGTKGGTQNYSGNGWKFENGTLTLESGSYDFSGEKNALRPLNPDVNLVVEPGAKLTGGAFKNEPTVKGAGTDTTDTFKKVTLNGTGSITAVNGLASGDWGNELYAVKTGNNTITASEPIRDINRILLENVYPDSSNKNTVCINIKSLNSVSAFNPKADIILNQASHGLSLIMDSDGTPVIGNAPFKPDGNLYNYCGNGWHYQALSGDPGTIYLESGNYNFLYTDPVNKNGENLSSVNCGIVNEGSIIEDGVFHNAVANGWPNGDPTKTHKIEGGTFAAGLYYNNGEITGGAFNGKDSIFTNGTVLSGNYRSVTVKDGTISKVNDTLPLVPNETGTDWVQSSAWNLYSYADTVLTVESNVDITNINGQEIGKAFSSIYPNGETDKTVVRFEMPDSDVELNSTKIVVPDPKPEPKPEPEPEAPTYTLTVKGGTFTYNGGEAMTNANVPVDAEVKVTLNQSAVPEGMVFDLWAMDEASLLGNPAVAYNQESFTIPAGSVAKGSTVTVEAQYRDATIESEPSILGTAAIIGVAGAGTAVIVWQGYRIGMELYEKYFQPTPEETAAEQPAPEAPAAAAS